MNKNIIKMFKSLTCISGGIISIVANYNIHFYGEWTKYEYYGGDAYTGIQNATADAARNVYDLGGTISKGLDYFFLLAAVLLLAFGLIGLIELKKSNVGCDMSEKTQAVQDMIHNSPETHATDADEDITAARSASDELRDEDKEDIDVQCPENLEDVRCQQLADEMNLEENIES